MTKESPGKVSIIIPVYNGERYLQQCIDSLLTQTYDNLELLFVDDGSVDSTPNLLADYAARDRRLTVLTQKNAGPAAARNVGMLQANGDFLYFFDADDYCEPTLIESLVERICETEADFVVAPYNVYDERVGNWYFADWAILPDKFPEVCCWHDNPDWAFRAFQNLPWNKLFRTSFVRSNNLRFEEDVFLTEDLMFCAPAVVHAQRIAFLKAPLIFHREGSGYNIMAKKDLHPLDFIKAFSTFKRFLEEEGVFEELSVAYVNWVLDGIVYNIGTLNTLEGFTTAINALTSGGGLKQLGLNHIDEGVLHEKLFVDFLHEVQTSPVNQLFSRWTIARDAQSELTARIMVEWRINREKQQDIEALQEQSEQAWQKNEKLAKRCEDLEHQLQDARDQLNQARAAFDGLKTEFDAQMNAAEQKIGQAICWVPRRVQEAILRNK